MCIFTTSFISGKLSWIYIFFNLFVVTLFWFSSARISMLHTWVLLYLCLYNALSFKIFVALFLFLYTVTLTVFSFCVFSLCSFCLFHSHLYWVYFFPILLSAHILFLIIVSLSFPRVLVFFYFVGVFQRCNYFIFFLIHGEHFGYNFIYFLKAIFLLLCPLVSLYLFSHF